jgi:hypothetical protein
LRHINGNNTSIFVNATQSQSRLVENNNHLPRTRWDSDVEFRTFAIEASLAPVSSPAILILKTKEDKVLYVNKRTSV